MITQTATAQILEKRTSELIEYAIDCSLLLDGAETISVTPSIAVTSDQAGLVFGATRVNTAPVTFSDGKVVPTGKVLFVWISGGVIPAGSVSQTYTIRPVFTTSTGNKRESTVLLLVMDTVK